MCAEPVIGSRSRVPGPLEFRHVLTQLRFRLVDPEGAFAGETLDEIALLDVNTTGVMDVETGALGAWGVPAELGGTGIETVPITGSESFRRSWRRGHAATRFVLFRHSGRHLAREL